MNKKCINLKINCLFIKKKIKKNLIKENGGNLQYL